jgi:hypothetical protein
MDIFEQYCKYARSADAKKDIAEIGKEKKQAGRSKLLKLLKRKPNCYRKSRCTISIRAQNN